MEVAFMSQEINKSHSSDISQNWKDSGCQWNSPGSRAQKVTILPKSDTENDNGKLLISKGDYQVTLLETCLLGFNNSFYPQLSAMVIGHSNGASMLVTTIFL